MIDASFYIFICLFMGIVATNKSNIMKRSISSFLFILLSIQFGLAQQKVEKSFEGIHSIRINTASGDCHILKGSGSGVNVLVEFTYDPDDFETKMEQNGARLVLEEKFHAHSMRGESNWTLKIPDGLEIDFSSGSGNLELSDLDIEMKFNTGSGDASVEQVNGELDFNSGSGDFKFNEVEGEIKANSGSGNHNLKSVNAMVKANTGSGDVDIDDSSGEFKMNTGSGDIEAENITLLDDGKFNTGSGDVEISLQTALDHDIQLNSGSGDAILDFNGQKIEGTVVMKAKKRGGDIQAPFDFDQVEEIEESGDIYIKKTRKFGGKDIEIYVGTGTGRAVIRE
jgi:hypothetical protein